MTILIKYCGGCNPWYDRVAVVEQLRHEFPDVQFLYASHGITVADIVLVVCGCPSKCVLYDGLRGRFTPLIIGSLQEYEAVREKITQIML